MKQEKIVKKMKRRGWFYAKSEYQKAMKWVRSGVIPTWFEKMMQYFVKGESYDEWEQWCLRGEDL